jgi:hypothetical protein
LAEAGFLQRRHFGCLFRASNRWRETRDWLRRADCPTVPGALSKPTRNSASHHLPCALARRVVSPLRGARKRP